jgi:hypothetical protein
MHADEIGMRSAVHGIAARGISSVANGKNSTQVPGLENTP